MNAQILINNVQKIAFNTFSPAIFAVYKITESDVPTHIGTCFAFEYRGRRFLVTAAHVIDHKREGSLAFAATTGGELIEVLGAWHVVNPGDKPREEDPFDFAWHELTSEEIARVPCVPAAKIEDTRLPATGLRLLTMIGFPVSKNKKIPPADRKKRRLVPKRAQYSNTEIIPSEYFKERGMSQQSHIAMGREQRAIDSEGLEDNTIGHHGFSGGPMIYAGLTEPSVLSGDQKVVGVVLEGNEEIGVVIALRISVVLRHIDGQIATSV